ncbi:hypothetical protein [Nonomuraea soli]|uniref:Uncharacterized protein n=1 Tax=Nonomuraea soli TaxID=1032476 RepID=A0A7W0CUW0_9ACTN|nr:hypothetical protein [Nonomuraea soli]MBA2897781.1 hypothetical protein [Nonomuraea soli]
MSPISEPQARTFIQARHYSGTYPAAVLRYGLWERHRERNSEGLVLVGAAVLSIPVNQAVLTSVFPRLEPYQESLELGRFVLTTPCPPTARAGFWPRRSTAPDAEPGSAGWSASPTRSPVPPWTAASSSPAIEAPSTGHQRRLPRPHQPPHDQAPA